MEKTIWGGFRGRNELILLKAKRTPGREPALASRESATPSQTSPVRILGGWGFGTCEFGSRVLNLMARRLQNRLVLGKQKSRNFTARDTGAPPCLIQTGESQAAAKYPRPRSDSSHKVFRRRAPTADLAAFCASRPSPLVRAACDIQLRQPQPTCQIAKGSRWKSATCSWKTRAM